MGITKDFYFQCSSPLKLPKAWKQAPNLYIVMRNINICMANLLAMLLYILKVHEAIKNSNGLL